MLIYWLLTSMLVGVISYLFVGVEGAERYYEMDDTLRNIKTFFIASFIYQYMIWKQDYIKKAGRLILIILVTMLVWAFEIALFLLNGLFLFFKLIAYMFMKIFSKYGANWNDWWQSVEYDESYRVWRDCKNRKLR